MSDHSSGDRSHHSGQFRAANQGYGAGPPTAPPQQFQYGASFHSIASNPQPMPRHVSQGGNGNPSAMTQSIPTHTNAYQNPNQNRSDSRAFQRNPQDGQRRGGKGEKKGPFWKGKQLADKEEQLKYIGHCRKWMRDDDKSKLVQMIRDASEPLESMVNCQQLDHDVIEKLLEILTCENLILPLPYEKNSVLQIFSKVINSQLILSIANIQEYCNDLFEHFQAGPYHSMKTENVYKLLEHLLSLHESESAVLWPLIRSLHFNQEAYLDQLPGKLTEDINELHVRCKKLQERTKEIKKKKAENKQFVEESTDYGSPYKEMDILPSKSEITKPDHTKLRKLMVTGEYPSAEVYLDIHFKLLREDMIRPMRQGIQNFLNDRNVRKELYMYEYVRIVEMYCEQRQGLLYRITFTTCNVRDPTKIKWDRVQRLKFGTLLCILTYGANNQPSFDNPIWAVVAHRDEKELTDYSRISIRFQEGFKPEFEFNKDYFIVESRQVYYEAYFHTLTVLKEMTPETIPMKEILLGRTKKCDPPRYLNLESHYVFENIFPDSPLIPVLGHWPHTSDFLDSSQYRALELALTKEVALIQGPPGTGKTYVGAHALRVILATRQHIIKNSPKFDIEALRDESASEDWIHAFQEMAQKHPSLPPYPDQALYKSLCEYPILILTYTNHALDQFLEYLLPFEKNIIRIGTRSENEELKEKTLPKFMKQVFDNKLMIPDHEKKLRYRTFDLQKELKSKQGVIKEASKKLCGQKLYEEDFRKFLDPRQCASLFEPEKEGFKRVGKQGENKIDLWLNQHAPHQRKSGRVVGTRNDNNSRGKNKNKEKGKPVSMSNRYAALGDNFDEDEMESNVDERRREFLKDLELLPPQDQAQPPQSPLNAPPPIPVPRTLITPDFNDFGFGNFDDPGRHSLSNAPHTQRNYVRNLSNVNQPPFDDAMRSPLSSRPDSPISIASVATTDIIESLHEDNFLHHDSDDDDAVDEPFQAFYDDLRGFNNALTMEQARDMYFVDTQTGAEVLPDNIMNCEDLWSLKHDERRKLYDFMFERRKQENDQILTGMSNDYTRVMQELQEKQRQLDVYVLKQAAIVGMTTTGAARHSELLMELHPRIIFVEEAAEVLEAHILACLSQSVEHLILIGDHQQLRPSNAVYDLSLKYNLDVSLFERLVNNQVEHVTLTTQHRMRPEISALIKPIYPNLRDYPDVYNYKRIRGVGSDIFFIDHRQDEDRLQDDSTSHTNSYEAEFIAHFAKYLLKQGYESTEITILTFYMGQKFKILDYIRKLGITVKIRCTTVDKYQGEENEIIIFSVVRSNHENKIGYCRVDNRVCVALSRAKQGFYIIGNADCLKKAPSDTKLWTKVIHTFGVNLGPSLPLSCQNHPKTTTMVCKAKDFEKVKNGGCDMPCNMRLICGHQCQQVCHPDGHEEVKCYKDCNRIHEPCKHPCVRPNGRVKKCYEECDGCLYPVQKMLDECGHTKDLPCSVDPVHSLCDFPCQQILPCNHPCPSKCGEACKDALCTQNVTVTLQCEHNLNVPCYDSENLLTLPCKEKCDAILDCGCPCPGTCAKCLHGTKHVPCNRSCDNPLICSHPCLEKCHRPKVCSPCTLGCINHCPHTQCGLPCGELCVSCIERCGWACRHYRCSKLCFEPCDRDRCNYDCMRMRKCGHPCMGLCGEPCPNICKICDPKHECFDIFFGNEDDDDARFLVLEDCGHIFEVSGFDYWMDVQKGGKENTGKVQLPFCPNCKTPIRKNLRYGKIIKEALLNVEDVKRRVINEMRKNIIVNCGEIANSIQLNYLQLHFAQNAIVQYLAKCSDIARKCDHRKLYTILDLLKIFADLYDTPEHIWRNCQAHKAFLTAHKVEKILEIPICHKNDELHLLDLQKLSQRCLLSSLFTAIEPIVTEDKSQFTHLRNRFTSSLIQHSSSSTELIHDCELFLANVKLKYKYAPVTEQERLQIARAVDVNRGGWYRCRNGHLYGIGDCGGAIEQAKCNECGAPIGGTGHRVGDDNVYAGPEMGGNDLPAWPGQPGFL